jgi:hypothetical protein
VLKCTGLRRGLHESGRADQPEQQALKFVAIHLPMLANAGDDGSVPVRPGTCSTDPGKADGKANRLHGWADADEAGGAMGLDGRLDVLVPGLRVRHTGDLWIGTVRHVMPAGNTIKVQPEGTDQERWFDADEFEPWADVPPSEAIRRRYLTDPVFHQLVTYQRQLLQLARQLRGDDAAQDLVDAGGLAVEMERDSDQAMPCVGGPRFRT